MRRVADERGGEAVADAGGSSSSAKLAARAAYELARALDLMNGHHPMDTFVKAPHLDRELALETLLGIRTAVAAY